MPGSSNYADFAVTDWEVMVSYDETMSEPDCVAPKVSPGDDISSSQI